MKYLSVCSGVEAASVAWEPLGWKPLAFSEIEAFPRAVLQHHYPDVPLHGDFTELKDQDWIVDADLLCGGTPCQAFSVAGLRKSLDDDRGNLTLQFVLLANAIDALRSAAGKQPAWVFWENVPGVLSTRDNAFGAFLGGLCGRDAPIAQPEGGWTRAGVVAGPTRVAAWRVLDSQHFGVAQRRKRVFVLALGGPRRWTAADALLPIIKSSEWHPAPSRGKGEVAPTIPARSTGGGGLGTDFDCDGGLRPVAIQERAVSTNPDAGPQGKGWQEDIAFTLEARNKAQSVVAPVAFAQNQRDEVRLMPVVGALAAEPGAKQTSYIMAHGQANAEVVSDGSPSLTCNHEAPILFDTTQVTSKLNYSNPQPGDPSHPLASTAHPPLLVRMREGKEGGGKGPLVSKDQSLTLATANDQVLALRTDVTPKWGKKAFTLTQPSPTGGGQPAAVMQGMVVRRLVPEETEALQGFPRGYTRIPWRGKPAEECPDGPRYKSMGNSWTTNVVRYLGEQIERLRHGQPSE